MRRLLYLSAAFSICLMLSACQTTKKKSERGWIGKSWDNTTARFNGYYNADVILKESFVALETQHEDNYNQILEVYPYRAAQNPQALAPELDRAIEKVTTVAAIHESSQWVDDCYVLLGKAQFLKQDFESAEETFGYFAESFDPNDPSSRVYKASKKRKSNREERKKEEEEKRKVQEEERKQKEKTKEEERKIKEADKIQEEKDRKLEQEVKEKLKKDETKIKESIKNEKEQVKKEKIKVKEDFAKKEDKLEKDIKKIKEQMSKAQKKARDSERDRKLKERKKKVGRAERDQAAKVHDAKTQQEEDRFLAQIAQKESALSDLSNQEQIALDKLDQKVTTLEEKNEKRIQDKAEKLKAQAIKKEKEDAEVVVVELDGFDKVIDENKEEPIEGESEADRKKKELDLTKRESGGFLKHKAVYSEGLLWLAKTYIERNSWGNAEYLLDQLSERKSLKSEVAEEIPVAKAYLNIKQKKYDLAIPELEFAIDNSKSKTSKARYAYILAQLHEENNDPAKAYEAFATAADYSKDYEMKINAELSQIRSGWAGSRITESEALKQLKRLRRDSKNEDYVGQIYFTSAEIKLASGKVEDAKEDFQKAIAEGGTNKAQRAESYYRLANLFFLAEDYVPALNFYDSTLLVLNTKQEQYFEVKKKSDNLKEIARQTKLLEKQDSLLALAQLSPEELDKVAERIIRESKEAEPPAELNSTNKPDTPQNNSPFNSAHNSTFFAYNRLSKDRGAVEFDRKWGDRSLQDNWRRSAVLATINDDEDTTEEVANITDQDRENDLSSGEKNHVLRDVPRTEKQLESTNKKITYALFELGSLLRTKIQNYKKSNETLTELLDRYPNNPKKLDSYYLMYLNYLDLNQNGKANEMKKKISTEFSESNYAQILNDPNYLKEVKSDLQKVEEHYASTYAGYQKGNYSGTIAKAQEALEKFGNKHAYRAKYDLLKAMSIGNVDGKDAYVKELKDLTDRHRNTPEATKAQEIMRFLKGDAEAFDSRLYEEDLAEFTIEDDKLHYVLIVTYDLNQQKMNDAKITISDYNEKYFKLDKLRLNNLYLNNENKAQIILVRKFSNKEKAMNYYNGIKKNKQDFLSEEETPHDVFAVTSRNYRELMKQKSAKSYRAFFEKEYLKN